MIFNNVLANSWCTQHVLGEKKKGKRKKKEKEKKKEEKKPQIPPIYP